MLDSISIGPPWKRIVAASDGSELSGIAVVGAAALATGIGADLHVFHAVVGPTSAEAVTEMSRRLVTHPFQLTVRDLSSSCPTPAQAISSYADELGEAVVCLATHGLGGLGTALIGSTALDLLAIGSGPIIAFGPRALPATRAARVIACVDGSEFSELSVSEAVRWASALGVPLWLVQVVPPGLPQYVGVFENTYLHNLAKQVAASRLSLEWEVLHSIAPARALLEMFGEDGETMLVMATHGRRGLERIRLGSVATEVVREAFGPVVLVGPGSQSNRVAGAGSVEG
jgi:nucleotide-binding universal stress UspA family protein